jgi:hypothetical protein
VYVGSSCSFNKTGGTIYGTDGGADKNTTSSGDSYGHTVYLGIYGLADENGYYRDTTAGIGDCLSTAQLPVNGTDYGWTKK